MFDAEAIDSLTKAESISAACVAIDGAVGGTVHGVVGLPNDYQVHDLEKYLAQRRRATGNMTTNTLSSFASYVLAHAEAGAAVFVKAEDMSATAVLNLGTPDKPGHADNRATLQLRKTAAYIALGKHTGNPISQQAAAEFLEDWRDCIDCFADGVAISNPLAIAAIRKLTIEALRKRETTVQNLSASKSDFESVAATSIDPIPTLIYFRCHPYKELESRHFNLRLGVLTGDKDPRIVLRIVKAEQHDEEMAAEFAELVRAALPASVTAQNIPVLLGAYSK